jgi:hypothetical protein
MKVTGFSFIRNAIKYDYPMVESIRSILPVVDHFVIAVGNSDDQTRELVKSIGSDKIRIIDTIWDESKGESVLADETNKAFQAIEEESDWAFYLQGDECLHEKDYDVIRSQMAKYCTDQSVDGFLFKYYHFFGAYKYIGTSRKWYRKEIRIIRNNKNIISWNDAQGFRFRNKSKLHVKEIDAHVYHYGWVKPPVIANRKSLFFIKMRNANFVIKPEDLLNEFDYHHIDRLELFKGVHPSVMHKRIASQDWDFEFDSSQKGFHKMKFKHKVAQLIEDITGYRIGEYRNYILK